MTGLDDLAGGLWAAGVLERWPVWLRVGAAALLMPLGPLAARLALGLAAALVLAALVPVAPPITLAGAVGELAFGAVLGVAAGLPLAVAPAIAPTGPPALAQLGGWWAAALFFTLGGPALWVAGLARGFTEAPGGAWGLDPAALGRAVFYGVFMLGLPVWLTRLYLDPLLAWVDRVGHVGLGAAGRATVGPLMSLALLAALWPVLVEVLAELWREGLSDPGAVAP